MNDLPAMPVSAAPRTAPSKAARAQDSSSEIRQGQQEDGLFHQELSREINALQGQKAPPGDTRDKAESAGGSKPSIAPEEGEETAGAVNGTIAAMLVAIIPLPAPIGANPLSAPGETGIVDTTAMAGAVSTLAQALSEGTASDPASPRGTGKARTALIGADSTPVKPSSIQSGAERTADNAKADFLLAASAAQAESAASGKFLRSERESLDPAAAPDARLTQRHAAEAPLPAGMNLASASPTQIAHTNAVTATITAHVTAPGWDRGLGEKVVWMAGQQLQVAELHLNPPELGPLQITLTVDNDQASAQFVSQHASVREAIEAAMPRLREMLAESGITLGNTNVGAESFREPAQQEARSQLPRGAAQAESGGTFGVSHTLRATRGLVDIFA